MSYEPIRSGRGDLLSGIDFYDCRSEGVLLEDPPYEGQPERDEKVPCYHSVERHLRPSETVIHCWENDYGEECHLCDGLNELLAFFLLGARTGLYSTFQELLVVFH